MGLASFFASVRNARLIADLSAETAIRSHQAVWQVVGQRARSLPAGEARGYVRARARDGVERQLGRILTAHDALTRLLAAQILERALDQVVTMVMREMESQPARSAVQRRAA